MLSQVSICLGVLLASATAEQPEAPKPVVAPMRSLPWGQLNFLQTTDTHGWHAGHLQEAQYSADWGDYVSFANHMHEKADELGVDLLLIDTGDRVEGNGLYDASSPKGRYTYDIFKHQAIDVLSPGNHELYLADAADREYEQSVPNFRGNYLASNLDYIEPKAGKQVPMAPRFRKFTTKNQGLRILAFGFIFDFTGNANNTVVQPVEKTIQEKWFQDAIREDVDLFLVAGHVTLPGSEYKAIYEAIRKQNWDIPIQFFGGHSHIRDFKKYDSKAYGLQSGRYMETIGFMSIDGISNKDKKGNDTARTQKAMSFKRRYIDNNLFGFHYHTGLNSTTFPTKHGQHVSSLIHKARKGLNLDQSFGCAPRNLWLSRAPYPSEDSILTWLETEVIPDVATTKERENVPRLAIINSGAMRFDLFQGKFTVDTTFIISPFLSQFVFIKDVPYKAARNVITLLNNHGPIFESAELAAWRLTPPEQDPQQFDHSTLVTPSRNEYPGVTSQRPLLSGNEAPKILPGYTTKDDGGEDGDDTIHAPINFYNVPNCIQSPVSFPESGDPETVDMVFLDFIQPWILTALRFAGQVYHDGDVELYRKETLTELMTSWIKENWKQDC